MSLFPTLICSAIGNERIESLIQEDQNVKRKRERYEKQSSLLSKLTRQLSIHDNRAAAASSWSDSGTGINIYIYMNEYTSSFKYCECNREKINFLVLYLFAESSPKTNGGSKGEDWMNAFNAAASGQDSLKRYGSGGHSRRYSDPAQNGEDDSSGSGGNNRRTTPNRLPPAPPQSGGSSYRY